MKDPSTRITIVDNTLVYKEYNHPRDYTMTVNSTETLYDKVIVIDSWTFEWTLR